MNKPAMMLVRMTRVTVTEQDQPDASGGMPNRPGLLDWSISLESTTGRDVDRAFYQMGIFTLIHDTEANVAAAYDAVSAWKPDPWPEPPVPIQRYEVRLADACEALHMSLNGSSDPLRSEEEMQIVEYLRTRLREWSAPSRDSTCYDNAYRSLIIATLGEYEGSRGVER